MEAWVGCLARIIGLGMDIGNIRLVIQDKGPWDIIVTKTSARRLG